MFMPFRQLEASLGDTRSPYISPIIRAERSGWFTNVMAASFCRSRASLPLKFATIDYPGIACLFSLRCMKRAAQRSLVMTIVEKPSTSATDRRTPDAAWSKILTPLLAADLLLVDVLFVYSLISCQSFLAQGTRSDRESRELLLIVVAMRRQRAAMEHHSRDCWLIPRILPFTTPSAVADESEAVQGGACFLKIAHSTQRRHAEPVSKSYASAYWLVSETLVVCLPNHVITNPDQVSKCPGRFEQGNLNHQMTHQTSFRLESRLTAAAEHSWGLVVAVPSAQCASLRNLGNAAKRVQ